MSAAQAVFDTSELFEAILLKIPLQTLLLSQRVSRRWRDMIARQHYEAAEEVVHASCVDDRRSIRGRLWHL